MITFPLLLLRLGVALALGAFVGAEREYHEHSAGMRTNALVALGSALFMVISIYGFWDLLGIPHLQFDPSRIASYVVAGIGFLGAGTIFRSGEDQKAKGLTTAATVWVVAAIGLACGAGMLWEAIGSTVLTLIVLILLRLVERAFSLKPSKTYHLSIETEAVTGELIGNIYDTCTRLHISIEALEVRHKEDGEVVYITCDIPEAVTMAQAIGELHALSGMRGTRANVKQREA